MLWLLIGIILGEIIWESSNWQHINSLKITNLGANWQLFRLERIAKCSYFILFTQNIKFHWIVMKIKIFLLPIWWYNRDLFPRSNKYNVVFVLNGLTITFLGKNENLAWKSTERKSFRMIIILALIHDASDDITAIDLWPLIHAEVITLWPIAWPLAANAILSRPPLTRRRGGRIGVRRHGVAWKGGANRCLLISGRFSVGGAWGWSSGGRAEARVGTGSQEFGMHHDFTTNTLKDGTTAYFFPVKNLKKKHNKIWNYVTKIKEHFHLSLHITQHGVEAVRYVAENLR